MSNRLSVACVGSPLPDEVMADLSSAFDITFAPPEALEQVVARGDADALLVTVDVKIGEAEVAAFPERLKAIATYSVGMDHLDLQACAAHGVAVFNTPQVLADSVADMALFLILGAARRGRENIDLVRSRAWSGWTATQLNGIELAGKRLGMFGMGAIGQKVAGRARGFGMTVSYSDPYRLSPEREEELGGAVYFADPKALAGEVDIFVLAAPATPETRGFLCAETLAAMKPGVIVINIGRGDLVVDEDLIAALKDGRVYAAGLDVFNGEPKLDPRYFDLPNVFMTPHMGSSTIEARRRMAQVLIDALLTWREGGRPRNQVI